MPSMCAQGQLYCFFIPEVASSSYPRENYFMGIILRNKEAMTSPPNCRPAASSACSDATCVIHCSGGRWCHVQAFLVFWFGGGCNLPCDIATLYVSFLAAWMALTAQPPASNDQRSGHASHWECPDFVIQFLYVVRVGIAVQHFAASGLRGMYLRLIQHLNIKKKDISLPLWTLKIGDGRITHHSSLSHGFHFAHIFYFHQVFGKGVI